jgi:hypothetical protein
MFATGLVSSGERHELPSNLSRPCGCAHFGKYSPFLASEAAGPDVNQFLNGLEIYGLGALGVRLDVEANLLAFRQ